MKPKHFAKYADTYRRFGLSDSDSNHYASMRLPLWPKETPAAKLEVRNAGAVASIRLDGPIGIDFWTGEGITAQRIDEELKAIGKFGSIEIELNSFGGDAFEGINIHTLLSKQKVPVTVNINGIAASAASILAVAADDVRMAESAMMMIHDASIGIYGNESDHRKYADILEQLDGQIAATYARKSGKPASDFRPAMDDETWYTPDQAIEAGLADSVDAAMRAAACAFDLSGYGYRNVPRVEPADATAIVKETPIADRIQDHLNTLRTIPQR